MKWLLLITVAMSGALGVSLFLSSETPVPKPVGIVVPHHDMVASARSAYMKVVGQAVQPKTIVLLSPDHFHSSKIPLTASTKVWETSEGTLAPNLELIKELGLRVNEADFNREHGVTTILRDIKTFFPDSLLVPIIVHTKASYSDMESLVGKLYATCPDCLLISSVDYSHTVQADLAYLHDVYTTRELYQGDAEEIYEGAEVDSPASLAALALWARLHNAPKFDLFSHTNSGYITGRQVGEMTTHIIGGYSQGEQITIHDDTLTLLFGGDTMFARGVATTHQAMPQDALTGSLGERFFWGVDAAIVNLEGVFSSKSDYQAGWYEAFPPELRFRPRFIEALTEARITAVSLANNHRFDGGEEDYEYTKKLLKKNSITPLANRSGNDPDVLTLTQGKTKVAVMTITLLGAAEDLAPSIRRYQEDGYFVIVYAHFGREEESTASPDQEAQAKRFIDAGASLIIGSHPHVVQPVSIYKGVPIVYSLGNLLFDQTESKEVQVGAVLGVKIDATGQELFLVPVSSYLRPEALTKKYPEWTSDWLPFKNGQEGNRYFFPNN